MAYGEERSDPDGGVDARRYSAFISYSHADAAFAKRLHHRLETYRLPKQLKGGRLKPLFRDEDELAAAPDLTAAVRNAIESSDFLIVVCSPHAKASPWVAREIDLFRSLRGGASVLAALADGDPAEAFPEALNEAGMEPLAADFRGDATGRRLALIKLVAVLAGVPLDELLQRDAQRRFRNLALASGGTVAALAVVAGLSFAAMTAQARADAEAKRAGGLNEFMISDLRKGLEAAGRHDLLDQVNKAALQAQTDDLSKLTPDQLLQRAKLLQGMVQDAEKTGDLPAAKVHAVTAYQITDALLRERPKDPQRLFAHAQSEYWIGFVAWREGDGPAAKAHLQAYADVAGRLVASDPANDGWRMEQVYAAQNLGGLALRQAGDGELAERHLQAALRLLAPILERKPNNADALSEKQQILAWLADSQRRQGRLKEAAATRDTQRALLESLLAQNPRDIRVKGRLLFHALAVARIADAAGETEKALRLYEAGLRQARSLQGQDPDNKDFPKQARMFELFQARAWLSLPSTRRPPLSKIVALVGDCAPLGPGSDNEEISDFCLVQLARVRTLQGDAAGASAALAPLREHAARRHDVLTARWGLDLAAEARPVQLAKGG